MIRLIKLLINMVSDRGSFMRPTKLFLLMITKYLQERMKLRMKQLSVKDKATRHM